MSLGHQNIKMDKKELIILGVVIFVMAIYFILATPVMMDDGFHYEGFTESLAKGKIDFKSFYGFQGLSILSVPIYWLIKSKISIIITSAILSLLSIPLAYLIGRDYYENKQAGLYSLILFLLTPFPYTTMMRGFQEAALLFFILLIIYGSINKKIWVPIMWGVGAIVKPFALVLFPLFIKNFWNKKIIWVLIAMAIGGAYLATNYYQTGVFINNAAIGSYQGNFDTGNPPPLSKSFVFGIKGFLRVGANLLLSFRKIMITPLIILLGALSLLLNKKIRLRFEIISAITLNVLLLSLMSFSFSKYLLPAVALFSLASINYLIKYKWLIVLVLIDSIFVFLPIYNYFGINFWSHIMIYLLPLVCSVLIYGYILKEYYFDTRSQ